MKKRIALFTTGTVVALAALAGLGPAGAAIWAHIDRRDSSGYYTTHAHRYATGTRALATAKVDVDEDIPNWVLDKVRVRVEPVGGRRVFVGLARAALAAFLIWLGARGRPPQPPAVPAAVPTV